MMTIRCWAVAMTVVLLVPALSWAQGKAKLIREAAKYVLRPFGREVAEVGAETVTRKIEVLALRYGDDVLVAVQRVGPRSLRLVEQAGEQGAPAARVLARWGDAAVWIVKEPKCLALVVRCGDQAAEAMLKHPGIAEPLLESFGAPAAGALKAVSEQNARRLAMLAQDGQLARIGKTSELLDTISRYGDAALNFIWQHQEALQVAAALAAFLAQPQPFVVGSSDITSFVPASEDGQGEALDSATSPDVILRGHKLEWIAAAILGLILLASVAGWIKQRKRSPVAQVR